MIDVDTNCEQLEYVLQNLINRQNLLKSEISIQEDELIKKKNQFSQFLHTQQMKDLHFLPQKMNDTRSDSKDCLNDEMKELTNQIAINRKKLLEDEKNILYLDNVYFSLFEKHYAVEEKEVFDEQNRLIEMKERERQRIATDLHDTVVQDLVYLSHQTELIQKYIKKDLNGVILEIADMKKNIKSIIEQIREKIYDLRPMSIDDLGWEITFERLKEEIMCNSDIQVQFQIEKPIGWNQYKMIALYRIIRECSINVKKHAQAKVLQVKLLVEQNDLFLSIIDDGIGIKEQELDKKNHFGMIEVKENVLLLSGQMKIISNENEGTKITIRIPYLREENEKND